jgi:hypothetical protein
MDIKDTPSPTCANCLKIRKGQGFNVSDVIITLETCNYCCPPIPPQMDISGGFVLIQPSDPPS